ncbi:replication initiator protein [Microviridae sp.]|nr:replication initiator protein [Microviridae sp.]
MPCYFPRQGYPASQPNENGKKPISFQRPHGFQGEPVTIPCGQCIGCRLERSRQWAIRCMHEAQMWEDNCFITLTYSPENIPPYGNLRLEDWQLFMKRYRKKFTKCDGTKIRFFMCGEYGDNLEHSKNGILGHPHYHACIFNHNFDDRVLHSVNNNVPLYTSATLAKLWPYGFSTIGDVTFDSAAYTARYVLKKVVGKNAVQAYECVDPKTGEIINLKREFTTMSRRPGVGKTWYDKYKGDLKKDFITVNGVKVNPPKYYDSQLELEYPDKLEELKQQRKEKLQKAQANEKVYDRLTAAHKIKQKKLKQLPRNL